MCLEPGSRWGSISCVSGEICVNSLLSVPLETLRYVPLYMFLYMSKCKLRSGGVYKYIYIYIYIYLSIYLNNGLYRGVHISKHSGIYLSIDLQSGIYLIYT